jgi:hypothetical protein
MSPIDCSDSNCAGVPAWHRRGPVTVNDSNIKGPFETGWGYDTIHPTVNGKLGLPLPPEQ